MSRFFGRKFGKKKARRRTGLICKKCKHVPTPRNHTHFFMCCDCENMFCPRCAPHVKLLENIPRRQCAICFKKYIDDTNATSSSKNNIALGKKKKKSRPCLHVDTTPLPPIEEEEDDNSTKDKGDVPIMKLPSSILRKRRERSLSLNSTERRRRCWGCKHPPTPTNHTQFYFCAGCSHLFCSSCCAYLAGDHEDDTKPIARMCKTCFRRDSVTSSQMNSPPSSPSSPLWLASNSGGEVKRKERRRSCSPPSTPVAAVLDEVNLRKTLRVMRRDLGPDHEDTASTSLTLGLLLHETGQIEDAEPLLRDALASRIRTKGAADPSVLEATEALAAVLLEYCPGEAVPLFWQVLNAHRSKFGYEHPKTLNVQNRLAEQMIRLGRYSDAKPLLLDLVEKHTKTSPKDALFASMDLVKVFLNSGEFKEATKQGEDAIQRCLDTFGPKHAYTWKCRADLGEVLMRTKKGCDKGVRMMATSVTALRSPPHNLDGAHPWIKKFTAILLAIHVSREARRSGS